MPVNLKFWPFSSSLTSDQGTAKVHNFREAVISKPFPVSSIHPKSPSSITTLGSTSNRSVWLSALNLGLCACLFILFDVVLAVLWILNSRRDGFALVTSNHYSWTYGPTAILVLVVAIWRQIDYHSKVALPWVHLDKEGATARTSIFLDYISPLQIISFWTSIRNADVLVISTIIGFVLLKIITLASTGLMVELPTPLASKTIPLQGISRINGSLYNQTQYISEADSSLVYTAFGIMAKDLRLPKGITKDLVYETIDLPSGFGQNSDRIVARVGGLMPDFHCKPAEVSINPNPYDSNATQTAATMSIISPDCRLMGGAQPIFVLDANSVVCPQRQIRGNMVRVNCSSTAIEPFPNWQLLTLSEVLYNQTLNTSQSDAGFTKDDFEILSWTVVVNRTISLLCQPGYELARLNTTYTPSLSGPIISTSDITPLTSALANFEDEDLALTFTTALADAAIMFGDPSESQTVEEYPNTMFKMMASVSGGSYDGLLDQQSMADAAQSTFQHIAAQVVSKNLLYRENSTIQADLTSTEDRLHINLVAWVIMISGFGIMAMICLLLLYLRPRQPIPRSENIATVGETVAASGELQEIIHQHAGLAEKRILSVFDGYVFSSQYQTNARGKTEFTIFPFRNIDQHSDSLQSPLFDGRRDNYPWWKPILVRRVALIIIMALPLAAIAVLEALQRLSDRDHGIVEVSTNHTQSALVTRLIPALVMLIIATSFNSLDFNISVLAPFNSMRSRAVSADQSVQSSLIDKLPPIALWNAFRHRQFAALCSSTAAIIGSVLTIVVSGLYTAQEVPNAQQASLQSLDAFNTSWTDSGTNDSSAAVLTSLTESLNLSYAAFTFDELAFPAISKPLNINDSTRPRLQLKYPALRGSLTCSSLASDLFNVSASYVQQLESSSASVLAQIPLPSTCPFGGPGGNLSFIDLNFRVGFQQSTSYIGKLLDIHVGPYDPIQGAASGEASPRAQKDNPPGCPSLALIYGYVDVRDSSATSVMMSVCYQQIQRVQTTVSFDFPSMAISASEPPTPDEDTVELLPSSDAGDTAFSYRIQQHMDQSLSLFNQSQFPSANLADTPVDGFFQGVLFGRTPLPLSILGQNNAETLMKGINAFYRRYMAQAISANMRVAVDPAFPSLGPVTYQGTVLNASQTQRLVQHGGAKLALQILLGLMTLLGSIACKLTRLVDLVPYNPCTIFGKAVLLAGSSLCRSSRYLDGAEDSRKYRLDWWPVDRGSTRGSITTGVDRRSDLRSDADGLCRRRYGIDAVDPLE
ncbi:hypothetical protein RBB50_005691 [Rhinocladiella similis]